MGKRRPSGGKPYQKAAPKVEMGGNGCTTSPKENLFALNAAEKPAVDSLRRRGEKEDPGSGKLNTKKSNRKDLTGWGTLLVSQKKKNELRSSGKGRGNLIPWTQGKSH